MPGQDNYSHGLLAAPSYPICHELQADLEEVRAEKEEEGAAEHEDAGSTRLGPAHRGRERTCYGWQGDRRGSRLVCEAGSDKQGPNAKTHVDRPSIYALTKEKRTAG